VAEPGQGTVSIFRFNEAAGRAIYGLVVGLGLPVTFTTPQQWQKHDAVRETRSHRAAAAGLLRPARHRHRPLLQQTAAALVRDNGLSR
jgi:crossover junction endodeoxyribonuclease RuvC